VQGLTKRFGHVVAVKDLSFEVQPGRVTGFLGPNGAGKTTTLRMLLGLVHPTAGTATILGRRYDRLQDPTAKVGAVLEATSFHPSRRARDHLRMLALAAGIEDKRIDEVLELVGLTADAKRKVRGYSLGMRQRLELAGALLGDPSVLIMDEPSNGLDPQGIAWLRTFFRYLASDGRTILVSSHILAEMAHLVDDVIIISQGETRAQGALDSILASVTTQAMRAQSPEAARLCQVVAAAGYHPQQIGPDMVRIAGAAPETIGPLLAQHQVVLYELVRETTDLESVFFALTSPLGPAPPPGAGPGQPAPMGGAPWAPWPPGSAPTPVPPATPPVPPAPAPAPPAPPGTGDG